MPDKDGPLLVLGQRLLSCGPPSLSVLMARIGELDDYEDFITIIRELLPEREGDILGETTPSTQMASFASSFEERYFPIEPHIRDGVAETYDELTRGIPVIIRGIGYDDLHYIATDSRDAIQLMTYLNQDPYEDGDTRIALAEACERLVPAELLQRVPEGGIRLDELHALLDNTPHKALVIWGDIMNQSTGNVFWDTDCESYGYNMPVDWSRETVDELTREWHQSDLIDQQISEMVGWLEVDPSGRFDELLNFILQRREEVNVDLDK